MPHKWPLRIKSGHSKAPRPHANGIYTNYVQPNPTGGSRWIVQFMFNRIPPAGIGGSFNLCSTESHRREPVDRSIPAYKDWEDSPQSHHRQVMDRSSPTCALNNGKQRSGLNDPPPAGGGILEDS